jgi:hypothetical protein
MHEAPQTNRQFNCDQEVRMKLIVSLDRDEDGVCGTCRMSVNPRASAPSSWRGVSQGSTREEAWEIIKEAIQFCLEVRAEQGLPLTIETRQVEVYA